jgi:hypothetical protein
MLPRLKDAMYAWSRKALVVLAVVLALLSIVLLAMTVMRYGSWLIFFPLFSYISQTIFRDTGFNLWLVKGFSVFATMLFMWLFRWVVSRNPRRRLGAQIALASMLGFAYLGMGLYAPREMFFSYDTGAPTRWYAQTPEGIRMFDGPGYDPKYGVPLQPVTAAVVAQYMAQSSGVGLEASDRDRVMLINASRSMDDRDYSGALDELLKAAPSEARAQLLRRVAREAGATGRYDVATRAADMLSLQTAAR